jgi:hypothetical protein
MHRQEELKAFDDYAADLQKEMPSHVPADYVRAKLEALAHNPEIAMAWDLRNVDRNAAKVELQKVQAALFHLQRNPTADPARLAELNAYGERLNIAVQSHAILRKATLGILTDARKLQPPIDEQATALHNDVAAAVRYASTTKVPEEGMPDFANMDDRTFAEWTRKNVK